MKRILTLNGLWVILAMVIYVPVRADVHKAFNQEITLLEAIEEISKKYDVYFTFDMTLVSDIKVNYTKDGHSSADEAISRILKGTELAYKFYDQRFVIIYKNDAEGLESLKKMAHHIDDLISDGEQAKKIRKTKLIEKLTNESNPLMLKRMELRVEGQVVDESGEPLIGVNVLVKGTDKGTATDFDGDFVLEDIDENAILLISYIGYQSKEIAVAGKTSITIVLQEDSQTLDEVVVVGYGTQKKVNMTGAVDVISNENIENRQSSTVSQILQGQSPGLDFSVGSSGFEPGASMNINIRGMGSINGGSPFVLIDGFPGDMDRLNPTDIESISVLKDAAASAIYGARAPYGVILITTKSGKKNEKLSVTYSGNISLNEPDRLPQMLDSYTFARVINEMGDNAGGRAYSQDAIKRIIAYQEGDTEYLKQFFPDNITHYEAMILPSGRFGHNNDNFANYDWYDEYYGSSLNQRHNVSIQGGSDKTSYYVSAGLLTQDGVLNYGVDTYKRFNIMGKINTALTDWWDFKYETRFMKSPREKFNSHQGGQRGYDIMFRQIIRTVPTQAKYDGFGNYSNQSKIPFIEEGGTDKWETTENWHTIGTEIRPLKGWKVLGDFAYKSIGVDRSNQNFTFYEPYADGRIVPFAATVPSTIEQIQENDYYWATNLYSTYELQLNSKHNILGMLGMQYEFNKAHRNNAFRTNLIVKDVPSLETANGSVTVGEDIIHWSTQGYFGRLTYNFDEKYLFEANLRYDGTSRFKEDSRWGFFPSFSAGWNLNRESFWKPIESYVNTFKLRASWGQLGNQLINPYQDIALIPLESGQLAWILNYGSGRPLGYTGTPSLVSPNLTWETATTQNLGFNLAFLENRLQLDFDLFERITNNMIGPSESVPGVLGASTPSSNNATLKSKGWEASLRWNHNLRSSKLNYFVGLNIHDVKTVVDKYLNPSGLISDWYQGKNVGEIWGYSAQDLFQSQADVESYLEKVDMSFISNNWNAGDLKYLDTNGDGKVDIGANSITDHGDLSIIGNNTPRYQFGLSGGLDYMGFDFSFLIKGTLKRDYFIPTGGEQIRFWGMNQWLFTGLTPAHLDYFRDQPGDEYTGLYEGEENINLDSYWPRTYLDGGQNAKNRHSSTRYLQNAAYFRIQNAQIGYSLPAHTLSKIKIQKLRIYFSGENLFTSTSLLNGIDPVALVGFNGGIGSTYGVDRIYSLGFNATF